MMKHWIALALLGAVACSEQAEEIPGNAGLPAGVPVAAALAPVGREMVYVDVRTPEEYASGHITGAINIPYEQMETRWQELAAHKDRPLALYCKSGRRSGLALRLLQARGFSQLQNAGGFEQLVAQGLSTER
jgi:phage shock protein E